MTDTATDPGELLVRTEFSTAQYYNYNPRTASVLPRQVQSAQNHLETPPFQNDRFNSTTDIGPLKICTQRESHRSAKTLADALLEVRCLSVDMTASIRETLTMFQTIHSEFNHFRGGIEYIAATMNTVPLAYSDAFKTMVSSIDETRRLVACMRTFACVTAQEEREQPMVDDSGRQAHASCEKSDEEMTWTKEKNKRRCELVDKKIDSTLSHEEKVELENLQKEMLVYRKKVAPLPIDRARAAHDELLKKAAQKKV